MYIRLNNASVYLLHFIEEQGLSLQRHVCIGMNWISHTDLVKRVEHGKPLDNMPNFPLMPMGQPGKPGDDWTVGYTYYPTATN